MKTTIKVILGLTAIVVLFCFGFGVYTSMSGEPKAGESSVTHGGPPVKVVPSQRPNTIRKGTWRVGEDVKPGKYRTNGALPSEIPMCYWDVRQGSETGDYLDQGVTKVDEPGLVTLKKGQYFKTTGCEEWYEVKS